MKFSIFRPSDYKLLPNRAKQRHNPILMSPPVDVRAHVFILMKESWFFYDSAAAREEALRGACNWDSKSCKINSDFFDEKVPTSNNMKWRWNMRKPKDVWSSSARKRASVSSKVSASRSRLSALSGVHKSCTHSVNKEVNAANAGDTFGCVFSSTDAASLVSSSEDIWMPSRKITQMRIAMNNSTVLVEDKYNSIYRLAKAIPCEKSLCLSRYFSSCTYWGEISFFSNVGHVFSRSPPPAPMLEEFVGYADAEKNRTGSGEREW